MIWHYILKQMKKQFIETPVKITICKGLIKTPDVIHRKFLIRENHSSTIGDHKGMNKTYNRLRQNYFWDTMKKDIQEFIKNVGYAN